MPSLRSTAALFLCVLTGASIAFAEDPPPSSPRQVTVRGQISDAETGRLVDGATVTLSLSRERLRPRVIAVQGAYEVSLSTRLRPQHLTVLASHGGYYAHTAEREVDAAATEVRVDVALTPEPRPPSPIGQGGGISRASIKLQATASRNFTLALQSGWNLIAFPVAPSNPDPVIIFGSLQAQGVTTGTLYHWNGRDYEVVRQVQPGRAYWVHCTQAASVTVSGQPLADTTLALNPGAAMIGSPLLEPLPLTQVFVSRGQQRLSLVEAVQAGWIWPQYVTWDPSRFVLSDPRSGYQVREITPGTTLSFPPGQGVWIKALQEAVSVSLGGPPPDTTPPTGTISINAGAAFTTTPDVTLTLTATDDSGTVAQMQLSNDCTFPTPPEPFATTKAWTLTSGDGPKTVCAKFADAAGNQSAPVSDGITLDTSPPTGTVTINNGATYTTTPTVTLTLAATDATSGVSQMQFSNDGTTYTPPEPYATTKAWTLTTGDGSKTVSVKFRDAAGNPSVPATDTIILDTSPPSTPTVTDEGATTTSTTQLHVRWSEADDPHSGISGYEYQVWRDGPTGALLRDWTPVGLVTEVTATGLTLEDGKTYVLGIRATNGAGRVSAEGFSDGITVRPDQPPTGTLSINAGAAFTTTPDVTLTLTATDDSGTVAHMQFSNDGTTYSAPEPFATTKAWTLLSGDGPKTVSARFLDAAGNPSAPAPDGIILDTTPPTGTLLINQGAAFTTTPAVTLTLSATDATSGVTQMQFSNDGTTYSAPEPFATTKAWTLLSGDGPKTVSARFLDAAGNPSRPAPDEIILDTTPPSKPVVTDDGATTPSTTQLHATWTPATDPHSGVVAYEYQVRETGPTGPILRDWTPVGLVTEVTATGLTLTDGTTYVIGIRATNGAELVSAEGFSDGITVRVDRPPTGTLSINAGAAFTTTPDVTLTLTATDDSGTVAQMRFSNDGTTYTPPEPFATTKAWTLLSGDGPKTVSAIFLDAAGNPSRPAPDEIILDTTPPSKPVVTDDGATTPSTTQLHATWSASDAGSGIAEYRYRITQDSIVGLVVVDWTSTTATEVTRTGLTLLNGKRYYVGVQAKDRTVQWSEIGYSDGIMVVAGVSPPILSPIGAKYIFVRPTAQATQQSPARPAGRLLASLAQPSEGPAEHTGASFAPGELLVNFAPEVFELPAGKRVAPASDFQTTAESLQALNTTFGLISAERIFQPEQKRLLQQRWGDLRHTYLLKFPAEVDVEAVAQAYRADPHVRYAEPNDTVWILEEDISPGWRVKQDR